jgi:hypothetical protein
MRNNKKLIYIDCFKIKGKNNDNNGQMDQNNLNNEDKIINNVIENNDKKGDGFIDGNELRTIVEIAIIDYKNNKEQNNKDIIFDEINNVDEPYIYSINRKLIKCNINNSANLIDLFEAKDEKQFDNKIFSTQLNFDGEIYLSKIFMSYLILRFRFKPSPLSG